MSIAKLTFFNKIFLIGGRLTISILWYRSKLSGALAKKMPRGGRFATPWG